MKEEDLTALVRLFIYLFIVIVYLFCLLVLWQNGKLRHRMEQDREIHSATSVIVATQQSFLQIICQ